MLLELTKGLQASVSLASKLLSAFYPYFEIAKFYGNLMQISFSVFIKGNNSNSSIFGVGGCAFL